MTPEERARKLLHMSPAGSLSYAGLLANDIANAIREAILAAENDALERAATRVVEFLPGSAPGRSIAQIIRDLKHDDFEPSDGVTDTSVETASSANL